MDTTVKELTMVLLYLTSWKEEGFANEVWLRSWKGYNFDILNKLSDEELISDEKRSKSVVLTPEGEAYVKTLLQKYGIEG